MASEEQKQTQARTFDLGALLIEDCSNYDNLTKEAYMQKT